MNIWKISAQDEYKSFIRIDEDEKQIFENNLEFRDYQNEPSLRIIKDMDKTYNISDFMYYFSGTGAGTKIVSDEFKKAVEKYKNDLKVQFLPAYCETIPIRKMWVLNAYNFVDVLDFEKCEYTTGINRKGERVIDEIKNYSFKKEAFDCFLFKVVYPDRKDLIHIFATDEFIEFFEENGLTGLRKEKVFSI